MDEEKMYVIAVLVARGWVLRTDGFWQHKDVYFHRASSKVRDGRPLMTLEEAAAYECVPRCIDDRAPDSDG